MSPAKSKKADADVEYLVLDGINFPPDDTRRDRGQRVKASELPEKSLHWLVRDGHLVPLDGVATAPALELADEYDFKLTDVDGTGAGGTITKGDVEKFIDANKLTPKDDPANG